MEKIIIYKKHPFDAEEPTELGPGVACYLWKGPSEKTLTIGCPKCGLVHALIDHDIEWHDELTVSVKPSIRCGNDNCDAHFYITENVINYVI